LADLRTIFGDADRMSTKDVIAELVAIEEAPWGDLRGKPIDARHLARMLKPYEVAPKTIRSGDSAPKGYTREDLHDAWVRYLPSPDTAITATTAIANESRRGPGTA
jgi:hypothetical protein